MSEKITNLAKNTSYFTLALIVQKIISFTYFALVARALGPADLGKYYFAVSFAAIFSILIDLGQTSVLAREIAKAGRGANRLFGAVLATKLPLAALTALIVVSSANWLDYSPLVKNLIYLSTVCIILDSFAATFFSISRGFHNLSYESIASIIFQIIIFATGLTVIKLNLGLVWLLSSLVFASIFNFLYSLIMVAGRWRLSLKPEFDYGLMKFIIGLSLPFGVYAIFQKVYGYFDTVLLATLTSDYYVGLYQIPFKIINAINFLPMAFVASLYPAMSTYWAHNREQLVVTYERAMNYLIIISLPISFGTIALADEFVMIFKAGFGEAASPLKISMAALLFMFLGYPIGSLLNASDRQKINTLNMGITLLAGVVLNLLLIPRFQAVGASLTVLITSVLMLVLGLIQVPKIIAYRPKKILLVLIKALVAALAMALLAVYLKDCLPLFVNIPLAGIFYFAVLFLLKGFTRSDILSIYRSFGKKSDQLSELKATEMETND